MSLLSRCKKLIKQTPSVADWNMLRRAHKHVLTHQNQLGIPTAMAMISHIHEALISQQEAADAPFDGAWLKCSQHHSRL